MEVGLALGWLGLFLALGLVALPVSTWLFPESARAGLSIPVGLATLAVVGHLVGQVAFGWPAAVAGLAVLVAGSYVAADRVEVDWRAYGDVAGVFALAFLLVVGIRAVDPAAAPLPIAIGEKFLDFGLLRTLDRTAELPPEDMWFAGEPVRYYYGGHMVTSLLATVSGTATRYAYNLALAGFYAALVSGAYGLGRALVAGTDGSPRLAGGFAAAFVGLAANLEPAAKLLVWLSPQPVAGWVVAATGLPPSAVEWTPSSFHYFDASRVLPTNASAPDSAMAATEFPFFAWLNGDLHAHMMVQPLLVLVVGLLLAYWRLPAARRRKRLIVLLGVLPPVAGAVGFVSLWSFPTVGGLVALTVALAPADPATLLPARYRQRVEPGGEWYLDELRRVGFGLAAALAVLVGGVVWTLPFWTEVMLQGPGRTVALWAIPTPVGGLLLVHGAFLAVFATALARRYGSRLDRPAVAWLAGAAVFALAVVVGFPALGLAGPLVVGGWWLCRRTEDAGLATMLVVAGAGIVLIVELVTVSGERFNTVFKPYAQVWLLWAVAAGALLARLVAGWPAGGLDADRERLRRGGAVLGAVLLVSTGVYAPMALWSHVDNAGPAVEAEGPTLDATAYLEHEYPADAPAIRWLNDRAGQPNIATAAPGGYFWRPDAGDGASAPASLTGLPTVLGWHHESQYRGEPAYERRLADVRDIYTSEHPGYQRELLVFYNVEYVYVGPAERARYGEITVGDVPTVSVAKEFGNVTIYRVD